jgi:tetratricopeptide (TPR) repeat protein
MRISRISVILASAVLAAILLLAQTNPPKTGPSTGGTPGSTLGSTTGNTPGMPSSIPAGPGANTTPAVNAGGAYFFGKVAMPDGSAPPVLVVIERVCSGVARAQAYTNSSGSFSFQVGQTQDMLPDSAVDRASSGAGSQGAKSGNLPNTCDLRASLAGYRSDVVSLSSRRNVDDPNVGTITLHPLQKVQGLTTSATSALAPKDARKAFDKGLEAVKKSRADDAQLDFLKATELYPRYAAAWLELGRIYEQREDLFSARNAYRSAIAADSNFVNPYERLYLLSVKERKWAEAAATTDRVMRLNPYDFPESVYYNAVANLELGKLDAAEKSAREALAMGTAARNPKVYYVLGVTLANKQDAKGAAEYLRTYLQSDKVADRERVTRLLAEVEKQGAATVALKPKP